MSLTGTDYFARARLGLSEESYLVDIYDSDGNVRIRLGQREVTWTDGTYMGCILNSPRITETIDLLKCTSGVGNVTIECSNIYLGGTLVSTTQRLLSDILRNGTGAGKHFVTWQVVIYSWLGPEVDADLRLEVFRGRLVEVSPRSDGTVSLELEVKRPWDLQSIPNVKAPSGRYFPVVYGGYTPDDSVPGALQYAEHRDLWPAEVDLATPETLKALVGQSYASAARPHIYEPGSDCFVVLVDDSNAYVDTSAAYGSGYAIQADGILRHGWRLKPVNILGGISTGTYPTDTSFTNPQLSCDSPRADETSTYATETYTVDSGAGDTGCIYFRVDRAILPSVGEDFVMTVRYEATSTGSPTGNIWLDTSVASGSYQALSYGTGPATFSHTFSGLSEAPAWVRVGVIISFYVPGATVTVKVYDVRIGLIAQIDETGDAQARQTAVKDVERLYCGADGLGASGGFQAAVADQMHEIHRDMLYRYAGVTGTPDGWSTPNGGIVAARANWDGRLWLHEPTKLIDVLERVQFEGGFVYHIRPTGAGMYIAVAASYSSAAATLDVQQDCKGLRVTHTPAKDLVTKYEVDFFRHPADEGRYIQHETATGTDRSDFNFGTTENVEAVALDYLVDTGTGATPTVSGWTDYRDLLAGNVVTQVAVTVLNPRYWLLEVGDIVKFSNPRAHEDPFANLTTAYYMVTKTERQPGSLGLSLREVYQP